MKNELPHLSRFQNSNLQSRFCNLNGLAGEQLIYPALFELFISHFDIQCRALLFGILYSVSSAVHQTSNSVTAVSGNKIRIKLCLSHLHTN